MLSLLLGLGAASGALAQPIVQPAGAVPHAVPRAACVFKVDGVLDEPCWESALELQLPFETRPGENIEPPVATSCHFTYDDARLYVGCRCADPDPSKIRARLSDRDSAFSDDFIGVVLDTFNDGRRAFEFFVNPLGVQMDLVMDDVGGNEDSSWDAIWDSAGKVTEQGYQVELAIPFTSLRFQRGAGEQTWGLDIVRIYPRAHRTRIGLNALDRSVTCYLCQASKISGFVGVEPGKNLELTPTFTAARNDSLRSFPGGGLQRGKEDYDPGLTLRWGVTPNLTVSAAVNPDFSQVEADAGRLDINEEFALFFPEKRPFFLEGADFFETSIGAVYTRTVANPDWGAKLTGKEGRTAFGAYVAQDERTNLLIPGAEGSRLGGIPDENLAGVLRVRRDVGESSALGGLLTVRNGTDYSNAVFGFDTTLRPTDADTLRVQVLGSRTEYPQAAAADFNQPTGTLSDHALSASFRHGTRNWSARASYVDFGENFRADSGFVPRVDYRQLIVGGDRAWYQDAGHWYSEMRLGGDWDQTEDQDGNLIERELEGWWHFNGPRESFLFVGSGIRDRVFNGVAFAQVFHSAYYEFNVTSNLRLWADINLGDRVDFGFAPAPGQARQGAQTDFSPGLRYNAGRHVKLNLNHSFRRLDIEESVLDPGSTQPPTGRLFKADLTELRLVYQFNVRAHVRLITQYSVVARNPEFFGEVAGRDKDLFNQLLFTYKINPQTALYLGYSDDRTNSGFNLNDELVVTDGLTRTGRSLFFKIGYAWVPR